MDKSIGFPFLTHDVYEVYCELWMQCKLVSLTYIHRCKTSSGYRYIAAVIECSAGGRRLAFGVCLLFASWIT